MNVILLLWIVLAYVLGSFPTSILAGKLARGIDIREHGSGNAGATNTLRVLGPKWGVGVGLVDLLKGWLAVFLPATLSAAGEMPVLLVVCGLAAVLGHAFPVFAGFRGGKGVATGGGMVLGLFPGAFLGSLVVWLLGLFTTGIVSVASILAALALPLGVLFFDGGLAGIRSGDGESLVLWGFSLALGVLVVYLHRKNISRILSGKEQRFEKARLFRKLTRKD